MNNLVKVKLRDLQGTILKHILFPAISKNQLTCDLGYSLTADHAVCPFVKKISQQMLAINDGESFIVSDFMES